jgi:hypothetical protein
MEGKLQRHSMNSLLRTVSVKSGLGESFRHTYCSSYLYQFCPIEEADCGQLEKTGEVGSEKE